MQMNGHHAQPYSPDHTTILIHLSAQVGRIEARQEWVIEDIRELRAEVRRPMPRRPLAEYVTPIIALVILASAAAGKISWAEALPSFLGLVGR